MDLEDISQWLSNQQATQTPLIRAFSHYLTVSEAAQIFDQFQSNWIRNGQVLWSGIPFDKAQEWADKHHLQTLTTAMGPLMDKNHPDCLRSKKTSHQWSRYIHGASAIFAWHIARFEKVTLLSSPPPQRLHPSGLSNYQWLEEPIIQGELGHCAVQQIITVHPAVTESEEFLYQVWPADKSSTWIKLFGLRDTGGKWRPVGQCRDKLQLKELVAHSEHVLSAEHTHRVQKNKVWREEEARRKLKAERKSRAKAQEEARQKQKAERKSRAKAKEEARQKQKAERKAQAKAQEETRKKLKADRKARAKAQEETRKKHKADRKARAKAQEEARKKLKAERKARAKAQEETRKKRKSETIV